MDRLLEMLRRRARRNAIVMIVALFVGVAGLVQAAHFHRDDARTHAGTDIRCLLCAHAERATAPAVAATPLLFQIAWSRLVPIACVLVATATATAAFRARAPPHLSLV
jgi:hypothetical protein